MVLPQPLFVVQHCCCAWLQCHDSQPVVLVPTAVGRQLARQLPETPSGELALWFISDMSLVAGVIARGTLRLSLQPAATGARRRRELAYAAAWPLLPVFLVPPLPGATSAAMVLSDRGTLQASLHQAVDAPALVKLIVVWFVPCPRAAEGTLTRRQPCGMPQHAELTAAVIT